MPESPETYLHLAALLALRSRGHVEPNPLVGAIIVKDDRVIGRGHHKRFGGLHAETEALADCRARGEDPRGSTIYVTLEPCNHYGKQPPCSKALIAAGIARVVIARRDPNPVSTGGAATLENAGIRVDFTDASPLATHISDPFIKRITTGMPWVIAKWAQTPDGRLVPRPGEPRWISNEFSRRRVHRLRARVDAVLTGYGTVIADDPMLTVRGVHARRKPKRVVIDSGLGTPLESALVRTARAVPLLIYALPEASKFRAGQASVLLREGAELHFPKSPLKDRVHLPTVLQHLHATGVSSVLVEAGPRLLKSFLDDRLADELVVYVGGAPTNLSPPSFPGYTLFRSRPIAGDVELRYFLSQK